jgi:hypothetical protein
MPLDINQDIPVEADRLPQDSCSPESLHVELEPVSNSDVILVMIGEGDETYSGFHSPHQLRTLIKLLQEVCSG